MYTKSLAIIFAKTNLKNMIILKTTLRHYEKSSKVELQKAYKIIIANTQKNRIPAIFKIIYSIRHLNK